jgi:hypothetical protein
MAKGDPESLTDILSVSPFAHCRAALNSGD